MVIGFNGATSIEYRDLLSYKGGNKANMLGPMVMPLWKELIHAETWSRVAFWGNRLRRVGGRGDPGDEDDSDDAEDVGCA